MVAVVFFLCMIVLLAPSNEGKKFRSPCISSNQIPCDVKDCIYRHQWCDGHSNCGDRSDEKYCQAYLNASFCNAGIHFQCYHGMCIPLEGYCDGYSSCPDQSDEWNCPCEELHGETGTIEYEVNIDQYRTQQKCWKIPLDGTHYLNLTINVKFFARICQFGNITVYSSSNLNKDYHHSPNFTICHDLSRPQIGQYFLRNYTFILNEDVLIRYTSNHYQSSRSNAEIDGFNITYQKIDLMCKDPEAFKCTNFTCIEPEKQCDGLKDCTNGRDEENCDYGALSAAYLNIGKTKSVQWMKNQQNADWGWKGNTHRAVLALHLAGATNLNGSRQEDELMAKQLELELFTYLLRRKFDKVSSAELAIYINALLAICHDPHNFYGYDLITHLKEALKTNSTFAPPFQHLTLCNAKEPVSNEAVDHLTKILKISSPNHGFVLELQALATMALSCIINNGNLNQGLQQNITDALTNIKKQQMEDGSFGNEYTTALVVQALIANNQESAEDWNITSSLQFLFKKQDVNGSFGDFMTTYLIMPISNAKSLVDVGKIECTDDMKRPRDKNAVSDINTRLGKKIIVEYSLFIGDEKDQIHPLLLRTPANITVLELMSLAADLDPKYQFKIHEIKKKKYVYEVSNILNDPENNKFWFIYRGSGSGAEPYPKQSPDMINTYDNDHVILWYKTLDSL